MIQNYDYKKINFEPNCRIIEKYEKRPNPSCDECPDWFCSKWKNCRGFHDNLWNGHCATFGGYGPAFGGGGPWCVHPYNAK